MEEFRIVKGFNNYAVSNFGNVKNLKTDKLLKPVLDNKGYYRVGFFDKKYNDHKIMGLNENYRINFSLMSFGCFYFTLCLINEFVGLFDELKFFFSFNDD